MGYPEESVGRIMTPDYVSVGPDWTAAQTIEHIRKTGKDRETTNVVLVTDPTWRFLGTIRLRQVILSAPDTRIQDIMAADAPAIGASEDREQAVHVMQRYDLFVLPVTDSGGTLVGIVTADDILDVVEEEFTEDFQKIGATAPLTMSYRDANVGTLYRRRVGWLAALIVVGLVSSGVILIFEDMLVTVISLTLFIPLLMGTGGNTGSQAATIMVRALATGDMSLSDWLGALAKELAVGLLLGVSLGVVAYAVGALRGGTAIAVVVGLSMTAIVVVANLVGFLLPLVMMRLGMDPAAASSPLVTSVMDVVGLLIYLGLAAVLLASPTGFPLI
jgi:magnesium transporter